MARFRELTLEVADGEIVTTRPSMESMPKEDDESEAEAHSSEIQQDGVAIDSADPPMTADADPVQDLPLELHHVSEVQIMQILINGYTSTLWCTSSQNDLPSYL